MVETIDSAVWTIIYVQSVLYIFTGKYPIFCKTFYESAEKYFLNNHTKTYYVFTDAKNLAHETNTNAVKIYQKNLGWPYNTLMRFSMFISQKEILKHNEYLFFCNANLNFVASVGEEILPVTENLVALQQPGYWDKPREAFPYETNPKSTAYIPFDKGTYYVMGALNGGKTESFLKMAEVLQKNIDKDLHHNIIAVWHDESHLNAYLADKEFKLLNPSYGYPEDWDLPFIPKIQIVDKRKFYDLNIIRGISNNTSKSKIKQWLQRILIKKLQ